MLPRRTRFGHWGVVGAALFGAALAPSRAAAEGTALRGVLVLDNGNVLNGAIERVGDEYIINVTGATLQVPVDQVERFAATVEEAYQQRRETLVDGTADRHLELAAWCLHLELFNQAARELLDARRIDAQNPGVSTLERRLQYRLQMEASRASASRSAAAPLVKASVETTTPEQALPAISVGAQSQFVRSIQPMLIRNCSTSGCHQSGANYAMQLDRWALQGRGSAELVRRNLSAVFAEIDVDDTAASPLLAKARQTHGHEVVGGSRALSARQLALLTDWVNQAVGGPTLIDVASTTESGSELGVANSTVGNAEREYDPNVVPASYAPRDAFDAEIFHRRRAERNLNGDDQRIELEGVEASLNDEPAEAISSQSLMEEP